MRLLVIALVAFLAGCLGPADSSSSPQDASGLGESYEPAAGLDRQGSGIEQQTIHSPNATKAATNQTEASNTTEPPAPMHWEGNPAVIAFEAGGPWEMCRGPLGACDVRPFQITAVFDLEATLSWDLPTDDLDLCLFRDADANPTQVSCDGINQAGDAPTTSQVLNFPNLPSGDYRLWVVTRHGVLTNYELDAVFSKPAL